MKEKKYDDAAFFEKYSQMSRSVQGLKGAGEWHEFREAASGFPPEERESPYIRPHL